jgi:hypothetical protein
MRAANFVSIPKSKIYSMPEIRLAADEDVYRLLDADYIKDRLGDLNVNIIFSCVNSAGWADDSWIEEGGTPSHIIKLPYDQVKGMDAEAVRELMLQKALERLHGPT